MSQINAERVRQTVAKKNMQKLKNKKFKIKKVRGAVEVRKATAKKNINKSRDVKYSSFNINFEANPLESISEEYDPLFDILMLMYSHVKFYFNNGNIDNFCGQRHNYRYKVGFQNDDFLFDSENYKTTLINYNNSFLKKYLQMKINVHIKQGNFDICKLDDGINYLPPTYFQLNDFFNILTGTSNKHEILNFLEEEHSVDFLNVKRIESYVKFTTTHNSEEYSSFIDNLLILQASDLFKKPTFSDNFRESVRTKIFKFNNRVGEMKVLVNSTAQLAKTLIVNEEIPEKASNHFTNFINDLDETKRALYDAIKVTNIENSLSYLDFINTVIYFTYQLLRHRNKFELMWSMSVSISNMFPNCSKNINKYITKYIKEYVMQIPDRNNKIKCESFPEIDETFSPKKIFEMVVSSQIVRATRNFILNLVSLRYFSPDMSEKFIHTLGEPVKVNLLDFSYNIIELTESFFRFGLKFKQTGSITASLLDKDVLAQFIDDTTDITLSYNSVYIGSDMNFVDTIASDRISAKSFLKDINLHIKKGDSFLKNMKTNVLFKSRLAEMKIMRRTIMLEIQSKRRMAPMGIILHGDPGIGKSSILENIYKVFAKTTGREYSHDLVFNRAPESKYWSGYDPIIQPIIHIPEVGSLSPLLAQRGDDTVKEMLLVCDNSPYCPEMPIAEDKGINYAIPELVCIDTNNPDMNLPTLMAAPAAIRRRFLYIKAVVKDEFQTLGGVSLDTEKLKNLDLRDKMDLWKFKVYHQKPQSGNLNSTIVSYSHDGYGDPTTFDMYQLCAFLEKAYIDHKNAQMKFMESTSEDISKYLLPKVMPTDLTLHSMPNQIVTESLPNIKYYHNKDDYFKKTVYICYLTALCALCYYSLTTAIITMYISFLLMVIFYLYIQYDFILTRSKNDKALLLALTESIKLYYTISTSNWIFNIYNMVRNISFLGYLYVKNCIVQDDRYFTQKWKVFSSNIISNVPSLILFTLVVTASCKLIIKTYKLSQSINSEGNIADSGLYNSDNIVRYVAENEKQTKCSFPLPKKKKDSDVDYDKSVINITPSLIGEPRNRNNIFEINNTIMSNMRFSVLQFTNNTSTRTRILGICNDYAIMNKHSVFAELYSMHISSAENSASGIVKVKFSSRDYVEIGDDLLLVRLIGTHFKDIRFSLCNTEPLFTTVRCIFANENVLSRQIKMTLNPKNSKSEVTVQNPFEYHHPSHKVGDCGLPLIGTIGLNTFLLGIHCAGGGSFGYATPIQKDKLFQGLEHLMSNSILVDVVSEGDFRLRKTSTIVALSPKSALMYEDIPSIQVYGHISDHLHLSPKSTLTQSIIFPHIQDILGISPFKDGFPKYMAPKMRHFKRDGEYISPENNFIKKVGVIKAALDNVVMENVVLSMTADFLIKLKKEGVTELHPVPLTIAQNGYPENFYYRAMKNNTSGGFLFTGTKHKYIVKTPLPYKEDAVTPNSDVMIQVQEIIDAYKRGESAHSLVGAQLKDEPRPREKVLSGNTRIFAMSSYDTTLVNRMYLMPFYSMMCEHRDLFYTKIGINMHSPEVDSMFNSLKNFSNNIMEGDYGGYDTSMPVGVGVIANSVVYKTLEKLGYNEEALSVVRGILTDNLFPTVVMDGALFTPPGFQPSGKYATAEDNSLRGIILLYYAFAVMCTPLGKDNPMNKTQRFKISDFSKFFLPITYGDDMLCGVKDEVSPYFNNITYSKFVSEIYYMTFTTSDKKDHISKFVDISSISFLKRSFRYHEQLKRYVAPLDKDSLMKSLCYYLPSKEVSSEDQLIQTCASVLRELYFHCNLDEEFSNYRRKFISKLEEITRLREEELSTLFPTWNYLSTQYSE